MMNYLWGGLILISMLFAVGGDLYDISRDTYQNSEEYLLRPEAGQLQLLNNQKLRLVLEAGDQPAIEATYQTNGERARLQLAYSDLYPEQWKHRFAGDMDKSIHAVVVQVSADELKVSLPEIVWPRLERMMQSAFDMAEFAAKLALGLIGLMALWLGLMKIAEHSGMVNALVRLIRPVLKKLFPEVPEDHPAMGAITLNLSANMLGLGNAATPMGIKAMEYLQELNEHKDSASNSMCMFLALNTSSVQLLPPVTVIALLGVSAGGLFVSIFLATLCSTVVGVLAARWYARRQVNP